MREKLRWFYVHRASGASQHGHHDHKVVVQLPTKPRCCDIGQDASSLLKQFYVPWRKVCPADNDTRSEPKLLAECGSCFLAEIFVNSTLPYLMRALTSLISSRVMANICPPLNTPRHDTVDGENPSNFNQSWTFWEEEDRSMTTKSADATIQA